MPDLRLLIVDDDPLLLDMMSNIAASMSQLSIDTCANGLDAVDLIQSSPRYDMILTDLMMPNLSGLEVVRFAHAKSDHTLIALVTGFGSSEDAVKAIRMGCFGFVHKPFRAEELLLTLKNMVRVLKYRMENADLRERCRGLKAQLDAYQQRHQRGESSDN